VKTFKEEKQQNVIRQILVSDVFCSGATQGWVCPVAFTSGIT
jgi:spore maturation protein SpmB